MSQVIRNRHVEDDRWETLPAEATTIPQGPVIVPLSLWKAHRDELLARRQPVGVWLKPDDEPGELAGDVQVIPLIAVQFPKFTDGRGYSTASLLRRRYGYTGELRAFGDVGRDQLFYLKRVGFDSFALAPHRDPVAALDSFNDFTLKHQGSIDDPIPLFRKREQEAA